MNTAKMRDPRLDFFRGVGMFIILIAHIPWNSWTDWIPARFGFSDAADLFVFCSGLASALAFAPLFNRCGWLIGSARIVHRVWQVYWAHIASFLVVLALVIAADSHFGGDAYARGLRLEAFFGDVRGHFVGLMSLGFVPNYFDILPMYLAILAMIPVVMALASAHRGLVAVAVLGTWLAANAGLLSLTADAATARPWFFNPFGWQLLFFTGFAFARGWIPAPPRNRRLAIAAIVFVIAAAPFSCQSGFSCYAGFGFAPQLGKIHDWLGPAIDKTNIGILRYIHFLATAYLAYLAVGPQGCNLRHPIAAIVGKVGQQTLAVFLTGLVAAQALGIALDVAGRTFVTTTIVNLLGALSLVAASIVVAWFKSAPWRKASPAKMRQPQATIAGVAHSDAQRQPV